MGKFTITPEQKEELKGSEATTPMPMEEVVRPGYGIYHNPATGTEIRHPVDPYHLMRRRRQGWKLGRAPSGLKEEWAAKQAGVEPDKPAPVSGQLDFFASVDAPPESETKHVVSQASQPELALVE